MAPRRLCKSADSDDKDKCPAVYVADDPTRMIAQGPLLDAAEVAELQQVAGGEGGVLLPTETLLRASGLFMAERGRPLLLAEVENFLATWEGDR